MPRCAAGSARSPTDGHVRRQARCGRGDKGDFGFYDKFTAAAWIRAAGTPTGRSSRAPKTTKTAKDGGSIWSTASSQVNLIKRKLDDSIRVETKKPIAGRTGITSR